MQDGSCCLSHLIASTLSHLLHQETETPEAPKQKADVCPAMLRFAAVCFQPSSIHTQCTHREGPPPVSSLPTTFPGLRKHLPQTPMHTHPKAAALCPSTLSTVLTPNPSSQNKDFMSYPIAR